MSIEAQTSKPEASKDVAAPSRKRATRATNSTSSRSRPKSAKAAPNTSKNPQRNAIARFIVQKYVLPEKVVYGRDMMIAYKLTDRHPEMEFWRTLPVRNQLPSMAILWTQEARNRLTREWTAYSTRVKLQRDIVLDEPTKTYTIGEKVGEDFVIEKKRPRSILEFCK